MNMSLSWVVNELLTTVVGYEKLTDFITWVCFHERKQTKPRLHCARVAQCIGCAHMQRVMPYRPEKMKDIIKCKFVVYQILNTLYL